MGGAGDGRGGASTPGTSAAIAAASSSVRLCREPAPRRTAPSLDEPGCTSRRLAPERADLLGDLRCWAPLPTATMAITAATPMTMPSMVSALRSRFARNARTALRMHSHVHAAGPAPCAPAVLRQPAPRGRPAAPAPAPRARRGRRASRRPAGMRATVGSWVTSTIVRPASLSACRWARISRLVRLSSAPVGSSARIRSGIVDQRAGDRDALLLAAGELARPVVTPIGEPTDASASARRRRSRLRDAGIDQRQLDVLQRGAAGEQVEALEDEADPPVADARARSGSSSSTSWPARNSCPRSADRAARAGSSGSTCPSRTAPRPRRSRPVQLQADAAQRVHGGLGHPVLLAQADRSDQRQATSQPPAEPEPGASCGARPCRRSPADRRAAGRRRPRWRCRCCGRGRPGPAPGRPRRRPAPRPRRPGRPAPRPRRRSRGRRPARAAEAQRRIGHLEHVLGLVDHDLDDRGHAGQQGEIRVLASTARPCR